MQNILGDTINTLKAHNMGHIKEPKGVDLIIKSEPLTNEERTAISEFIHQYKLKPFDTPPAKKTRVSTPRKKASA